LAEAERKYRQRWGNALGPTANGLLIQRTVQDAANAVMRQVKANAVPSKARTTGIELACFTQTYGSRPLDDLSPDDLLTYRANLIETYKPNTVNGRLMVLRRLVRLAVDLGWMTRRLPLSLLKGVPVGELPDKAWTPAEINALLKKAAQTN